MHHTLAPTFTGLTVPPVEEFLADWEETLELPNTTYFVAELDGRVVGHLLLEQEEPDLARPAGSVYLAVAATVPEARGRGVGVALTEQALRWAREAGCSTVHTDWRRQPGVVRFWPARGFRETFYRLARRVEIGCPWMQSRHFDLICGPRARISALDSEVGGGPGCPRRRTLFPLRPRHRRRHA